jgi:rhodanese-related sulfurtransferase
VAVYILYKLDQRRKFLNGLTVARVTPEELKSKMDANEDILILDMRNHLDLALDPVRIPGAFHVLPEHVQFQPEDVTPNRNIVLYCTCPNEATSARVAMQLQRMGLKQAHPLRGGLDAWRSLQLPLERLE